MPGLINPVFPGPRRPAARARPVAFPPAPLFDFALGDFVRDYTGKLVMATGYVAWQQWCIKALQTQQAGYPIYPRSHGIHLAVLRNQWPRSVAEADLRHRITWALTRTRRTLRVDGFVFSYPQPGVMEVSCVPTPTIGQSFELVTSFNF